MNEQECENITLPETSLQAIIMNEQECIPVGCIVPTSVAVLEGGGAVSAWGCVCLPRGVYSPHEQHLNRMCTGCLPTIRVSVAPTRCQYWWGGGRVVGLQVNKFEQVFINDHQRHLGLSILVTIAQCEHLQ